MNTFALMIELRQSKDRMSFVSPSNDTSAMMSVRCAVALYTHDCRPCASIVIRLMDWVGHWVTLDTRILARWQFLCAKHDELVSIWILIMSSVRDRMRLRCRRKVMKEWISSDVEIPFDIVELEVAFFPFNSILWVAKMQSARTVFYFYCDPHLLFFSSPFSIWHKDLQNKSKMPGRAFSKF